MIPQEQLGALLQSPRDYTTAVESQITTGQILAKIQAADSEVLIGARPARP